MSSEKKHPATPRRKQDARKKGQVLKSQELTSALILFGFVFLLKYWLPQMLVNMGQLFHYVWSLPSDWTDRSVSSLLINISWSGLLTVAPVLAAGAVIATAGNYFQVGTLFTFEPLKPQISRISLIAGAKRMFGVKAWVELLKSLLKVVVIGYFLYAVLRDNFATFPALQTISVKQSSVLISSLLLNLAWKISIAFFVIAIADYIYQWWDYNKNLRMTHEELKQEFKQTEGSPELKSAIKKKQRSVGLRRMMQDIPKADVVITNPTHYAVAICYDASKFNAPYVIAKGQDYLALKIKETAQEHKIVVMENKPLARALYNQVEIGEVVPPELYKAVAEVLAFVYRLKKKKIKHM